MGEIIIKVDLEGNGETIQTSIGHLKEYRDLLTEIGSNKDALAGAENIANIKKYTAELKRAELQIAQLQRKEQERAEKAAQKAREEQGYYKQLSAQYREALQRAKDLAAQEVLTGSERSKATQMAISEAKVLNDQLKAIDASMGNYQRNVGNYHGQLSSLSKTLKGFSGLGQILGNAIGVDMSWVHTIKEAGKALHDLKNIKVIETAAEGTNTAAKEVNTVATVQQTAAETALNIVRSAGVLGIGLAVAGLAALTAAVYAYIESQEEEEEFRKRNLERLQEQIKLQNELTDAYNKRSESANEVALSELVRSGQITKQEAEEVKVRAEFADKKKKIYEDYNDAIKASDEKTLKERGTIFIQEENRFLSVQEQMQRNRDAQLQSLEQDREQALKTIRETYAAEKQKGDDAAAKKALEEKEKALMREYNAFVKYWDEIDKKNLEAQKKILKEQEEFAKNKQKLIEEQFEVEQDSAKKNREEAQSEVIKKAKEGNQEYIDLLIDLGEARTKEQSDALAEIQEKQRQEEIEAVKRQGELIFDILQERAQAKKDIYDQEIKWAQEAIDVQVKLAQAGKANRLAEAEADKARLQREQIEQQLRLQKLKKQEAYFNLFASYAKDAKPGEQAQAATKAFRDVILGEVLARAFAQEGGIMKDIMQPVEGGTNDRGLFKGRSHAAGGITTILETQGGEGILTDDEVQNLGGPKAFYLLKDLLANPIKDDNFVEHQAQSFTKIVPIYTEREQSIELLSELRGVREDLQSIPRIHEGIDGLGNVMTWETTNGLIRKTTQKPRQI